MGSTKTTQPILSSDSLWEEEADRKRDKRGRRQTEGQSIKRGQERNTVMSRPKHDSFICVQRLQDVQVYKNHNDQFFA
jgi:hypothetical protein